MIKGINKQVLEVFETNNDYFEKALFFVKPEFSGYSENKLRELALSELKNSIYPPKQKHTNQINIFKKIATGSVLFIVGAVSGFLLSFAIWYSEYIMVKWNNYNQRSSYAIP